MNIRTTILAASVLGVSALAPTAVASAAGGNGASPCSQSGWVVLGSHEFLDTFGHTVVAPTVHDEGFSGEANPGQGFDWWEGSVGDGPVVPGVCNPHS